MILLESDELVQHTEDIIHRDTQQHDLHVDLTVAEIYRFTGSGSLDFGGSEFQPAPSEPIEPVKRNPDDDYSWWELDQGTYQARFNEKAVNLQDALLAVSPHDHAKQAGIIASSSLISFTTGDSELSLNFRVPENGCSIKENARFASMHILTK